MNTNWIAAPLLCLALVPAAAMADTEDKLLKLDRQWGEAGGSKDAKHLLAEKFISVDGKGVTRLKEFLAEMDKAGPPDGPYVAGDYTVQFIDDTVAVMVHTAGQGDDAHWSMHVWRKHDGKWKVFATAAVPAE